MSVERSISPEQPLVVSLCDLTGRAVEPWARAGHECWIIDLAHAEGCGPGIEGVVKIGADVCRWALPKKRHVAMVMAWPPCTHMATSGARWMAGKGLDALADSLHVVAACARICEASGAPYLIEHPMSTLATYWRKPDHTFDPCDYAGYLEEPAEEAYTKRTCLWTGGGFVMPRPRAVFPRMGSAIHRMVPSRERAALRSVTPRGFAIAVEASNRRVSQGTNGNEK